MEILEERAVVSEVSAQWWLSTNSWKGSGGAVLAEFLEVVWPFRSL